jgi:TPR repeat protein
MKAIGKLVLAIGMLVAQSAFAASMCRLEGLTDVEAGDAQCLFYLGTKAYHAKDFKTAAMNWKALIALKSIPVESEHLKVDAYNNLGFLYFFGMGIAPNKKAAIDYWTFATKSGNEESAYHLCHAYADRKQPTYAPEKARGYCKEALRRYGLLKEHDSDIDLIVSHIHNYLNALDRR